MSNYLDDYVGTWERFKIFAQENPDYRINEAILGGSAQITGSFSQLEAQDLANVLKYGSLPLALS